MSRFAPGQSGNPSGRPRSDVELARLIDGETQNGRELVEGILTIARNRRVAARTRLTAFVALLERRFGKAPMVVTLDVPQPAPRLNYDALTPAALDMLDALHSQATGQALDPQQEALLARLETHTATPHLQLVADTESDNG